MDTKFNVAVFGDNFQNNETKIAMATMKNTSCMN